MFGCHCHCHYHCLLTCWFLCRWLTLEESVIRVDGDLVSNPHGMISGLVSEGGANCEFAVKAIDVLKKHNGTSTKNQFELDTYLFWDVSSTYGTGIARSYIDAPSSVYWNASGRGVYQNNTYNVLVTDYSKDNDELFYGFGMGDYGGDMYDWYVPVYLHPMSMSQLF